jgi:glycosyltransferase involved in cell wall biosynthesis
MILVIEPIFSDYTHATVNAALLEALSLGCTDRPITFAAHRNHHKANLDIAPCLRDAVTPKEIEVEPAGGITWSRFRRHHDILAGLASDLKPDCVVFLAVTPETLFACVRARLKFPRLPIIAVLHGDLARASGWRSRDPRRRWFDHRSAIQAARRAGVRFVVLEDHIRLKAAERGLLSLEECDVWPCPISDDELVAEAPSLADDRLNLGFLGFAKEEKGFDDFLYLADSAAAANVDWCRFSLVGSVAEAQYRDRLQHVRMVPDVADRARYVAAVRTVDYACMFLRDDVYTLTSSATLPDAYAALRPIIALDTPAIRTMTQGRDIGYFARSRAELAALVTNRDQLFDRERYRQFQHNLDGLRLRRRPANLAEPVAATVERHLSAERRRA